MVWNQYVDEANGHADEYECLDGEEEVEPPPSRMSIHDWETWFSRDLMNMWMSLRQYREDAGVSNFIMKDATYSDFIEFCYHFSHGYANSRPS